MTPQKRGRAAGAATRYAETANACAAPAPGVRAAEPASVSFAADQRQKFVAGLFVVTESPQHGAGDRRTVLFFHTAHLHAKMARFDDHADALRRDLLLDGLGDLAGHALLDLQPPGEHVHQPR